MPQSQPFSYSNISWLAKRTFDCCISLLGSLLLILLMFLIGCTIFFTSRGPVLYKQIRIGKHGKPFTLLKFRSMRFTKEFTTTITVSGDTRITHIGKFLRKYKLDELPQLLNVFWGTMSFVGPRPDVAGYADCLCGNSKMILDLAPGMTGPANIFFCHEELLLAEAENPRQFNDTVIWPIKVALNMEYMKNWSFGRDIGYIFITIFPFLNRYLHLVEKPPRVISELKKTLIFNSVFDMRN